MLKSWKFMKLQKSPTILCCNRTWGSNFLNYVIIFYVSSLIMLLKYNYVELLTIPSLCSKLLLPNCSRCSPFKRIDFVLKVKPFSSFCFSWFTTPLCRSIQKSAIRVLNFQVYNAWKYFQLLIKLENRRENMFLLKRKFSTCSWTYSNYAQDLWACSVFSWGWNNQTWLKIFSMWFYSLFMFPTLCLLGSKERSKHGWLHSWPLCYQSK